MTIANFRPRRASSRKEILQASANQTEAPHAESASTYRSVAALAADIGLSERSTRNALRRGEIPHIRIGRRFILPRAAIAEWLRSANGPREIGEGRAWPAREEIHR